MFWLLLWWRLALGCPAWFCWRLLLLGLLLGLGLCRWLLSRVLGLGLGLGPGCLLGWGLLGLWWSLLLLLLGRSLLRLWFL